MTLLRTCAPWRHRNTSIDILLKWNMENITPDLCIPLEHANKFIDMQLKWSIRGGHHSRLVHLGDTGTHQ
jgi:hypothetical protein